ncbi:unnamed protein product [Trichobilharzia regenti]|nr:unnamed protein product [Trichobilharzia regenti]
MFNYGTEEQDNSTYNTSRRPSALAMKAYRQRQLQMDCTTTPNQTEKFDMTRFFQSAMPSSKSLNTSVVSIPIRKRMALVLVNCSFLIVSRCRNSNYFSSYKSELFCNKSNNLS